MSELCELRIGDLFFGEGYIRVTGKGDKQRLVPISAMARERIQLYLDERRSRYRGSVLCEITTADQNSPYTAYLLNAILGKLAASQPASPHVGTPIKSAMLYLLHHFKENPTLAETAANVGYAPPYFSALFKEEVGMLNLTQSTALESLDTLEAKRFEDILENIFFEVGQPRVSGMRLRGLSELHPPFQKTLRGFALSNGKYREIGKSVSAFLPQK